MCRVILWQVGGGYQIRELLYHIFNNLEMWDEGPALSSYRAIILKA